MTAAEWSPCQSWLIGQRRKLALTCAPRMMAKHLINSLPQESFMKDALVAPGKETNVERHVKWRVADSP